jgi:hypothetical protein
MTTIKITTSASMAIDEVAEFANKKNNEIISTVKNVLRKKAEFYPIDNQCIRLLPTTHAAQFLGISKASFKKLVDDAIIFPSEESGKTQYFGMDVLEAYVNEKHTKRKQ